MKPALVTLPCLSLAALALSNAASAQSAPGTNGETALISRDSFGFFPTESSLRPSLSRDGRYVAFESDAALLPIDLNGHKDIYVLDRQSNTLTLASRTSGGLNGNDDSFDAHISGDGRHVAFTTHATNLVALDGNANTDVLVKNLNTGVLSRVSTPTGGAAAANGASSGATVSFDGRYVAFQSSADNLDPLALNGLVDVFVRDMQTGIVSCASRGLFGVAGNGNSSAPSISDDGVWLAFQSGASNHAFGDSNGAQDVVVRNLVGGGITRVSVTSGGAASNDNSYSPSISADGRYVAFLSDASNFVADGNGTTDAFVHDRQADTTLLVSRATDGQTSDGASTHVAISGDGRSVAFVNSAGDITPDGAAFMAVYVRNLDRNTSHLVSRATGTSGQPNSWSSRPALAQSGGLVAFDSAATNLVPGDTNSESDVFLRVMQPNPVVYCTSSTTSAGCTPTLSGLGWPRVSQNSGFVVTCDDAPNNKAGLLFFSLGGRLSVPFGAGTFCVATPVVRTPVANSGGNPATVSDCSGQFSLDLNAYAKGLLGVSAPMELTQIGQRVNVQYWGRDPQGAIATTFLSDALEYFVGP
jgi:Tol biopolymer transport system component